METSQYDSIADQYHEQTRADLLRNGGKKLITELIERPGIKNAEGWDVLDIGCGTGIHLEFFAENYPDISSATGVDQSEEMVRIANRNRHSPRANYVVSDMDELPFANASFDFIFSRNALHYSDDVSHTFAGISRVLKPGGKIFFQVSHPVHNLFMKDSKNYSEKERLRYEIQGGSVQVAHPTYTIGEYVTALTSNNLQIAELKEHHGRSSNIAGYTVPTVLALLAIKPKNDD